MVKTLQASVLIALMIALLAISGCGRSVPLPPSASNTASAPSEGATSESALPDQPDSSQPVEPDSDAASALVGRWEFSLGGHTQYWEFKADGTAVSSATYTEGTTNHQYLIEKRSGRSALVIDGSKVYWFRVDGDTLSLDSSSPKNLDADPEVIYQRM